MGLVYQRPPTLRGLPLGKLAGFCAGKSHTAIVNGQAEQSHLRPLFQRNVNEGFSGGELKKSELPQLKQPWGPLPMNTVEHLMTCGLTRDDAVATLVQGFLKIELPGLPAMVTQQLERVLAATVGRSL